MRIAISGSSGFVGTKLKTFFLHSGHSLVILKRNPSGEYVFSEKDFEGVDAVINLAGESIFSLWTEKKKRKIKDSRIKTTRSLALALNKLVNPPKVVINASAIGYYGNGREKSFDETSPKGAGFLAEVVDEWEKALQVSNIRTVFARFGVILSANGGALKTMLWPFKMGLGGKIGTGEQFMSWIAIEDVIGVIHHLLTHEEITGVVNVVSPHPVRNSEFTKILGKVLNRPTLLPMPEALIRLILGEMGEDLLLSSTRVLPKRLLETGYPFLYPELEKALIKEIKK